MDVDFVSGLVSDTDDQQRESYFTDFAHNRPGFRRSMVSPHFLQGNSTIHVWIFGAIAEMIDNTIDARLPQSKGDLVLQIDTSEIDGKECIVLTDNGCGMSTDGLHRMLSFGYCKEDSSRIGRYGNGFKSGSMRLGDDAIVLTTNGETCSVGLLSKTFHSNTGAEELLIPIVTFNKEDKVIKKSESRYLEAITDNSIFKSLEDILSELKDFESNIVSNTGTRIIIYNLKKDLSGKPELDFDTDPEDVIISEHFECDPSMTQVMKDTQRILTDSGSVPKYYKSLREYCSILYSVGRMTSRLKIELRGKKVAIRDIRKKLQRSMVTEYQYRATGKSVTIKFGFSPRQEDYYGLMIYHKNRLIKCKKVGCQTRSNREGIGIVGVVEVGGLLEPIQNKQDFVRNDAYKAAMRAFGQKLTDYWEKKKDKIQVKRDCASPNKSTMAEPNISQRKDISPRKRSESSWAGDDLNSVVINKSDLDNENAIKRKRTSQNGQASDSEVIAVSDNDSDADVESNDHTNSSPVGISIPMGMKDKKKTDKTICTKQTDLDMEQDEEPAPPSQVEPNSEYPVSTVAVNQDNRTVIAVTGIDLEPHQSRIVQNQQACAKQTKFSKSKMKQMVANILNDEDLAQDEDLIQDEQSAVMSPSTGALLVPASAKLTQNETQMNLKHTKNVTDFRRSDRVSSQKVSTAGNNQHVTNDNTATHMEIEPRYGATSLRRSVKGVQSTIVAETTASQKQCLNIAKNKIGSTKKKSKPKSKLFAPSCKNKKAYQSCKASKGGLTDVNIDNEQAGLDMPNSNTPNCVPSNNDSYVNISDDELPDLVILDQCPTNSTKKKDFEMLNSQFVSQLDDHKPHATDVISGDAETESTMTAGPSEMCGQENISKLTDKNSTGADFEKRDCSDKSHLVKLKTKKASESSLQESRHTESERPGVCQQLGVVIEDQKSSIRIYPHRSNCEVITLSDDEVDSELEPLPPTTTGSFRPKIRQRRTPSIISMKIVESEADLEPDEAISLTCPSPSRNSRIGTTESLGEQMETSPIENQHPSVNVRAALQDEQEATTCQSHKLFGSTALQSTTCQATSLLIGSTSTLGYHVQDMPSTNNFMLKVDIGEILSPPVLTFNTCDEISESRLYCKTVVYQRSSGSNRLKTMCDTESVNMYDTRSRGSRTPAEGLNNCIRVDTNNAYLRNIDDVILDKLQVCSNPNSTNILTTKSETLLPSEVVSLTSPISNAGLRANISDNPSDYQQTLTDMEKLQTLRQNVVRLIGIVHPSFVGDITDNNLEEVDNTLVQLIESLQRAIS